MIAVHTKQLNDGTLKTERSEWESTREPDDSWRESISTHSDGNLKRGSLSRHRERIDVRDRDDDKDHAKNDCDLGSSALRSFTKWDKIPVKRPLGTLSSISI